MKITNEKASETMASLLKILPLEDAPLASLALSRNKTGLKIITKPYDEAVQNSFKSLKDDNGEIKNGSANYAKFLAEKKIIDAQESDFTPFTFTMEQFNHTKNSSKLSPSDMESISWLIPDFLTYKPA